VRRSMWDVESPCGILAGVRCVVYKFVDIPVQGIATSVMGIGGQRRGRMILGVGDIVPGRDALCKAQILL